MLALFYLHRIAECTGSSRNDRDLLNRCRIGLHGSNQCMTNLMIGNDQFLFIRQDTVFLLISCDNNFHALHQICLCCKFASAAYSMKCCFIHDICKFRSGCSGCSSGDRIEIYVIRKFDLFCMDFQNIHTTLKIRQFHRNTTVKSSRTEQCRVKRIRLVGRCQNDNTFGTVKSIHFREQLIQRLLTLIVAADASVTFLADRIDLVDKDDTRCFLACLFEQVTHFCSTHTDKHFNKLRTGDREEWYVRLTCNCFCQQCFTGSRRAYKQCTFWHRCSDLLIFAWIVKEIYDLCKQFFCFFLSCHIGEFDAACGFYIDLGIALCAKHHGVHRVCPVTHLAHHLFGKPSAKCNKNKDWQYIAEQKINDRRHFFCDLRGKSCTCFVQTVYQFRVVDHAGFVHLRIVFVCKEDLRIGDIYRADLLIICHLHKNIVADFLYLMLQHIRKNKCVEQYHDRCRNDQVIDKRLLWSFYFLHDVPPCKYLG